MIFVGIDIGSTASKAYALGEKETCFVLPTGWSGRDTAKQMQEQLKKEGIDVEAENVRVIATGYGRVAVDYADKVITEITCHGRGGRELFGGDCSVIDVGGQDTKVILVEHGAVTDFMMNDKCSAGTGKFLEVMANRLGVSLGELFALAGEGEPVAISSLCTVFAESEVISYIGGGESRENIAAGVVDSVANKVAQLCSKKRIGGNVILTGGLSFSSYFSHVLGEKLGISLRFGETGRYAGALGAALIAREKWT